MLGLRLLPVAVLLFGGVSASVASSHPHRIQFKRQASSTQYPQLNGKPLTADQIKPEWKAALDAATKAGKIPNIPPSTSVDGGTPTYPSGTDMTKVCSWSTDACQGPNDVYQAPDGVVGVQFDDGPTEATARLNQFLTQNNISATRFLIGGQIAGFPNALAGIMKVPNQQLCVHSYTHHQMTTLTSEQIAAELGWTAQIIYDQTGFIPNCHRCPYGDVDNRVRAIAEELFGLYHVSWNHDTNDWCVSQSETSACPGENPGSSVDNIQTYIDTTMAGPKSPGVIMLEHELSDRTVGLFEEHTWTGISKNGWKHANIGELAQKPWYANAAGPDSAKTAQNNILVGSAGSGAPPSGGSSSGTGTGSGGASASTGGSSAAAGKSGTSTSGSTAAAAGSASTPSSSTAAGTTGTTTSTTKKSSAPAGFAAAPAAAVAAAAAVVVVGALCA
ncbi:hypothetical protein OC834_001251 [Tilletia horrida]|nr:hypothetical protein OC834_001251 [Tilletia horrida]